MWLKHIFKNDGIFEEAFTSSKIRKTKRAKFSFVRFAKEGDAVRALKRNIGLEIKSQRIQVKWPKYDRRSQNNNQRTSILSVKTPQKKVSLPVFRDSQSY